MSTLLVGNGIAIEFESIERSGSDVDRLEVDGRRFSLKCPERRRLRTREHRRRSRRNADDAMRELDRIFRENVEASFERVALKNSEGMLVTYERNRLLDRRLDEVYRNAGLLLPTGGDSIASPSDITPTIHPETAHPLGF